MALERLKMEFSNLCPWGKITDLDTGQEFLNVRAVQVTAEASTNPVVTLTIEMTELVIETDGTVPPIYRLDRWHSESGTHEVITHD